MHSDKDVRFGELGVLAVVLAVLALEANLEEHGDADESLECAAKVTRGMVEWVAFPARVRMDKNTEVKSNELDISTSPVNAAVGPDDAGVLVLVASVVSSSEAAKGRSGQHRDRGR